MTLTNDERLRIADLRRLDELPSEARGWLEAIKRFTPRGGADREAIEAAIRGTDRRVDADGKKLPAFGPDGVAEADRRAAMHHTSPKAPDPGREAREFWDSFAEQERMSAGA
jgi:hypothetical protein